MKMEWTLSNKEIEAFRKSRLAWSKEWHKMMGSRYFEDIKTRRGVVEFKEELDELKMVYKKELDECSNKVEEYLAPIVHYMKRLSESYIKRQELEEKLMNLNDKTSRE